MNGFRIFLIVMVFVCLVPGLFLGFFSKVLVSKKKNTEQVAYRKSLKIKLIGYVLMMMSLVFAIFQSMIK